MQFPALNTYGGGGGDGDGGSGGDNKLKILHDL